MKYLLIGTIFLFCQLPACLSFAWDGFDADTADLVEIIPDIIPAIGSTVDVRVYDTDETQPCIVESVTRNRRTIEVVVRDPQDKKRTLVMEYR